MAPMEGAAASGRQTEAGVASRKPVEEPAREGSPAREGLPPDEVDYLFASEAPRVTDLGPFQGRRAFGDPALAETLLRAVALPEDWREVRGRPVEAVAKSFLVDLLKVVHGGLRLSEGFDSAVEMGREAVSGYDAAHGEVVQWQGRAKEWEKRYRMEKKVADEAGILLVQWREKGKDLMSSLEAAQRALSGQVAVSESLKGELSAKDAENRGLKEMMNDLLREHSEALAVKDGEIGSLELEVSRERARAEEASRGADDADSKLEWTTSELQRTASELQRTSADLEKAVSELKSSKEEASRAVDAYKSSWEHQMDIGEAGVVSYDQGFSDGLRQVKKRYPNLDVSEIVMPEEEGEEVVAAVDPVAAQPTPAT